MQAAKMHKETAELFEADLNYAKVYISVKALIRLY
jgi:hypothetical protein